MIGDIRRIPENENIEDYWSPDMANEWSESVRLSVDALYVIFGSDRTALERETSRSDANRVANGAHSGVSTYVVSTKDVVYPDYDLFVEIEKRLDLFWREEYLEGDFVTVYWQ